MSVLHWIEIPAAASSILNLYLAARNSQWNWVWGAVSVSLYAIIFYNTHLFADMSLQVIYLIFQGVGWWQWQRLSMRAPLCIVAKQPTYQAYRIAILCGISLFLISAFLLKQFTSSTTVMADALITALSLVALGMMSKKWLASWYLWIAVDLVSLLMFDFKHLYLTSGMYVVLLVMCIKGYQTWKGLLEVGEIHPPVQEIGTAVQVR